MWIYMTDFFHLRFFLTKSWSYLPCFSDGLLREPARGDGVGEGGAYGQCWAAFQGSVTFTPHGSISNQTHVHSSISGSKLLGHRVCTISLFFFFFFPQHSTFPVHVNSVLIILAVSWERRQALHLLNQEWQSGFRSARSTKWFTLWN